MVKNELLKRYWFVLNPGNKYGSGNIGVTAFSVSEAKNLIIDTVTKFQWKEINLNDLENIGIIENIDVQILDEGHVRPNMGVVSFKGVWYPFFNINEIK